jgi:hypothetical protein
MEQQQSATCNRRRQWIRSIVASVIIIILIYLVVIYDPVAKEKTLERFMNSDLVVEDMYQENENTYLVLKDSENDFTVTVKNSTYYDNYSIGQTITANRYIMVHEDGTEELIYYFSDKSDKNIEK